MKKSLLFLTLLAFAAANLLASPVTNGEGATKMERVKAKPAHRVSCNNATATFLKIGLPVSFEFTCEDKASYELMLRLKSFKKQKVVMTMSEVGNAEVVVACREMEVEEGSNFKILNVSTIPIGNYDITISCGTEKLTKKVDIIRAASDEDN